MPRRLAFLLACLLLGCATATIAPKQPPPPKDEEPTPRPTGDMYWRSGHWAWDEGNDFFYWVEGTWEAEREGYIWFPGEWEPIERDGERVWRWVPDRWVQIVDLERDPYGQR